MSDDLSRPEPDRGHEEAGGQPLAPRSSSAGDFSFKRVLLVIVPLVVLLLAGAVFVGLFNGTERVRALFHPPLVPGDGEVIFQGQPLTDGEVVTRHANPSLRGAIGFIDQEGRFQLKTEIEGDFRDGAYAGEHQVTVTARGAAPPGPAAPPLVTPPQYASFDTTPLRLVVDSSPDKNHYRLVLEDDPSTASGTAPSQASPEARSKANKGGRKGGSKATRARPTPTPDEFVTNALEQFDTDKDGQISVEETRAVPLFQRQLYGTADANQDGQIDREELRQAAEKSLTPSSTDR